MFVTEDIQAARETGLHAMAIMAPDLYAKFSGHYYDIG